MVFDLVGTSTTGDNGYVDNLVFIKETVATDLIDYQSFDNLDGAQPYPIDWNWSDAGYFGWNDWAGQTVESNSYSAPSSLWIPTDAGWTGGGGTIYDVTNNDGYSISFMYKGNLKFSLNVAKDLGYNAVDDPDGIVPANATANSDGITWELKALNGWKQFTYTWDVDSWLSAEKANLTYTLWDSEAGDGFVDDLVVRKASQAFSGTPRVESITETYDIYAVLSVDYDTTFTIVSSSEQVVVSADSELEPLAAHFVLPAANDWTQWKLNWKNPSGDIGSNLTIVLDNKPAGEIIYITPDDPALPEESTNYTFYDDFMYGITTGLRKTKAPQAQLHLYPNPAVNDLWLSIMQPLSRVEIYNQLGQRVMNLQTSERKISVDGLPSGIYLINVTDQEGTIFKSKFIKQ